MIKWAGTLLTITLLGLQLASAWYWMSYGSRRGVCVGAGVGCLAVFWWDTSAFRDPKGSVGWQAGERPKAARVLWWGHVGLHADLSEVYVPFWMLAAATGVPAAWLWFLDRGRTRRGCCRGCGYDLTGNTTGVCPECGRTLGRKV